MTKQTTHKLSPSWVKHASEVRQQIASQETQIMIFKGKILEAQQEIEFMRRHMSVTIGQIEAAEHLPPSLKPYTLSEDGTALIGEIEIKEVGNGVDNSTV